MKNASLSFN